MQKKDIQQFVNFIFSFPPPGFEALTEIQNLLNGNSHDPSVKESLIIDASNRFFTVIPSIHPHIIRDEDDFKSKVRIQYGSSIMFFTFCISSIYISLITDDITSSLLLFVLFLVIIIILLSLL